MYLTTSVSHDRTLKSNGTYSGVPVLTIFGKTFELTGKKQNIPDQPVGTYDASMKVVRGSGDNQEYNNSFALFFDDGTKIQRWSYPKDSLYCGRRCKARKAMGKVGLLSRRVAGTGVINSTFTIPIHTPKAPEPVKKTFGQWKSLALAAHIGDGETIGAINQIEENVGRNDITLEQAIQQLSLIAGGQTSTKDEQEVRTPEEQTNEYHVVTGQGFDFDLIGSQINKIRHYQKLPLTFDQAVELETGGHVVQAVADISFEKFILQFESPIAFYDDPETIINESQIVINPDTSAVIIFADGTESDTNDGIFDETMAKNELKQRIRDAIEDQLSIRENQILDPQLNQNSSDLTIDEIDFIRNNQDLVEEFQKTLQKPKDETKINLNGNEPILDQFIQWLRRFLN